MIGLSLKSPELSNIFDFSIYFSTPSCKDICICILPTFESIHYILDTMLLLVLSSILGLSMAGPGYWPFTKWPKGTFGLPKAKSKGEVLPVVFNQRVGICGSFDETLVLNLPFKLVRAVEDQF